MGTATTGKGKGKGNAAKGAGAVVKRERTAASAHARPGARTDVTVVLDAGGGCIKCGIAEDGADAAVVVPHGVARAKAGSLTVNVVADEILGVTDINGLSVRRPVDRGYVVNWELERDVLARVFYDVLGVDTQTCDLVITEAPFALPKIQSALDAMVFEEFGFKSVVVATPAMLAKRYADAADKSRALDVNTTARCGVVVDCGFSFAHATPILDGKTVARGVRRLNLGGKSLTNYLKELVSYRQWNMMDESVVIEDVKEKLCYVADDAMAELAKCKVKKGNEVTKEYVLPDGIHVLRGFVREDNAETAKKGEGDDDEDDDDDDDDEDDEDFGAKGPKKKKKAPAPKKPKIVKPTEMEHQFLTLTNERFMVPETLFRPSDIGSTQCGVPELVVQAVEIDDLNDAERALCYLDVILVGGCTLFPNFVERFERELRALVSQRNMIRVRRLDDPIKAAWLGGLDLALDRDFFTANALTREEYMANKKAIVESQESFEVVPSTRTGRLLEFAEMPETPSESHVAAEVKRLTPVLI